MVADEFTSLFYYTLIRFRGTYDETKSRDRGLRETVHVINDVECSKRVERAVEKISGKEVIVTLEKGAAYPNHIYPKSLFAKHLRFLKCGQALIYKNYTV